MPLATTSSSTTPSTRPAANADRSRWGERFRRAMEGRISGEDRMFFTEQLALLLDTGTPLHKSLKTLHSQIRQPKLREVIESLAAEVEMGNSFSSALAKHPEAFSPTYCKLIEASEGGGFMPQVLEELLQMEDRQERLKNTISSAATYPLFMLLFSLAVVVFVLVFVFPKFEDIFSSIKNQLPVTTVFLLATSDLLRHHWALLMPLLAAILLAIGYALHTPTGSYQLDRAKLGLPGFRDIFQQIYLVQLMRVLSLSLEHGVSIRDALIACRNVVRSQPYQSLITKAERDVQQGQGIARAFSSSPHVPTLAKEMLLTGEETGNLARVMARIADYYERKLRQQLDRLSKLAEPTMLILMGLVVGIIVSSLILPIFKLSRVVM